MRPAWRIVDRRWAMTIAVRPASRRRRPSSMRALGVQVDVRRRLVEDQDARVGDERAREGDELALAGGELDAALADLGVEPGGQALDELPRADGAGRGLDVVVGWAPGRPKRDVLADRPAEEERLLGHDAHLRAQRVRGDVAQVVAVDEDAARRWGRRSARRAWRTSTCRRPWRPPARPSARAARQVDVVERELRALVGAVGERHVVEGDLAADARRGRRASGASDEVGLLVEQLEDLVQRRHAGLVGRVDLRELLDRVEEPVERGEEADEHADVDRRPAMTCAPPTRRIATVARALTNSTPGKYAALRLTVIMFASRLRSLSSSNAPAVAASCAKARTTRTPDSDSCR